MAQRQNGKSPARNQADGSRPRPWHAMALGEVFAALGTTPEGLSAEDAAARLARYGPNQLPESAAENVLVLYLRQFASPLIYLLLAASVVSLINGEMTDAVFIFVVLQINALIGCLQEWRAGRSAEALKKMTRTLARVRRDGRRQEIDSRWLVPGDLVELSPGDRVPADIRLLDQATAGVDESLLTGESTPVDKSGGEKFDEATVAADRRNMIFAGSTVLTGRGYGVVTSTGHATELGRIAGSIERDAGVPPLVHRLRLLARHITVVMTVAIAILAIVLVLRGAPLSDVFLVAVALAVAAIPEGLPVAITVALSVAVSRMAARNVIVRSLPAVEGLGACTVIASDKTGTLTQNRLAARSVLLANAEQVLLEMNDHGAFAAQGKAPSPAIRDDLGRLAFSAAICNEASLYVEEDGEERIGDTVDLAFLDFARELGSLESAAERRRNITATIPYEPALGFAAVFEPDDGGPSGTIHVKGAGEVVLAMCRPSPGRTALLAAAEELAGKGYKVIAVASGAARLSKGAGLAQSDLHGLDLLGFVGLLDPLRPEVPAAVSRCRASGIEIKMVTGDHPVTALTIARRLGLAGPDDTALSGEGLARLCDGIDIDRDELPTALVAAIQNTRVFARIDPLQKLVIVKLLKRLGHFVAVTGDGVNDAPALNAAEIGIAMAHTGTDVAREASSLLLVDDNFASIAGGVEQGRIAYDNIRKVTQLLIATGIGEIVLFVLALIAGLPIPLLAVQLLWLNLVTNGIQHVALAFEPGEPGVMKHPPRPPEQPLFDASMVTQVALAGGYIGFAGFALYFWALSAGYAASQAQTAVLFLMVLFENVHVFNCRSEHRSTFLMSIAANPYVVLAVALALLVHLAATYSSGLSAVLHIEPLDFALLAVLVPIALGLMAVMEVYKWTRRNRSIGIGKDRFD